MDEMRKFFARIADAIQLVDSGNGNAWMERRPIMVGVRKTWVVVWDWEDNLLELSLLPDDVPITIGLSAPCNDPLDYEILRRLSQELPGMLIGIATEPTK